MGDIYSDYGSGSSSNSSSSLLWPEKKAAVLSRATSLLAPASSSYLNLIKKNTLEDVRREFQMNGSDSPYNPDEYNMWLHSPTAPLSALAAPTLPGPPKGPRGDAYELGGMGPAAQYLRQKSWPAPERTPAARLPRPRSLHEPRWCLGRAPQATSTPVYEEDGPAPFTPDVVPSEVFADKQLTEEQRRVLHTIPDNLLYPLLRKLRFYWHFKECRFCKNNGERMSYYRSHVLKDVTGRVLCPVLRAFTCPRCGAGGDNAHTIKYCPLSTNEERVHSAGMMHSVRMASGRRRYSIASPVAGDGDGDYFTFAETTPFVVDNKNSFSHLTELPPGWAALEQKLLQ